MSPTAAFWLWMLVALPAAVLLFKMVTGGLRLRGLLCHGCDQSVSRWVAFAATLAGAFVFFHQLDPASGALTSLSTDILVVMAFGSGGFLSTKALRHGLLRATFPQLGAWLTSRAR